MSRVTVTPPLLTFPARDGATVTVKAGQISGVSSSNEAACEVSMLNGHTYTALASHDELVEGWLEALGCREDKVKKPASPATSAASRSSRGGRVSGFRV